MPKKLVDKSQAYFWTRRWQEGERVADEDIKAGRVKTFNSIDDLIKDLEQNGGNRSPITHGGVLFDFGVCPIPFLFD